MIKIAIHEFLFQQFIVCDCFIPSILLYQSPECFQWNSSFKVQMILNFWNSNEVHNADKDIDEYISSSFYYLRMISGKFTMNLITLLIKLIKITLLTFHMRKIISLSILLVAFMLTFSLSPPTTPNRHS